MNSIMKDLAFAQKIAEDFMGMRDAADDIHRATANLRNSLKQGFFTPELASAIRAMDQAASDLENKTGSHDALIYVMKELDSKKEI